MEDAALVKQKFKNQQMLTKLSLEKQREMEENERKVKRQIEVDQERMDAERIAAKHLESQIAKEQQKRESLAHFKQVWDAQKSLKQRNESMENCF